MSFTIGSLFDGSGGFPLAASLCGGTPLWASEIEPYPIAVTKSRFPHMKHLGSVTDVKGDEVEPVDVITFGSPCQDLSVAGKRAGLKHEDNGDEETTRSGLFMEAVRIIREMRRATNGVYPRFAIWENVPGAFSSNKGEDFRTVCEELIKIVEPGAVMPAVPKNGWPYADCYCGERWSLAYRVYDAQYWGVPQRRRRIYLVLDLTGERAGKISFEREGLRGYFTESRTPWQATAADAQSCPGTDDREGERVAYGFPLGFRPENTRVYDGVATTICNGTRPGFTCGVIEQCLFENHSQDARYKGPLDVCPMLPAQLGTGGNNTPLVCEPVPIHDQDTRFSGKRGEKTDGKGNGLGVGNPGDPMNTLTGGDRHAVAYCVGNGRLNQITMAQQANMLDCMHDQQAVLQPVGTFQNTGIGWWNESPLGATVRTPCGGDSTMANIVVEKATDCIVFDKEVYNSGKNAAGGHHIAEGGPSPSLRTEHPPGVCVRYIVRRLTPTECARLQGFADAWAVPVSKDDFTDEEYRFWLNVRNTHAEINGKTVKEYTKEQMLAWYNKLHTDSSEYKLWGNGIALPTALYVMQGISDVINQ